MSAPRLTVVPEEPVTTRFPRVKKALKKVSDHAPEIAIVTGVTLMSIGGALLFKATKDAIEEARATEEPVVDTKLED